MGTKCIVGGDIFTPLETIPRGTLLIEDGIIEAIGPGEDLIPPQDCEIIEAHGRRVLPGLVDLHIHGLMGKDLAEPDALPVPQLLTHFGVTSFQASIPPDPLDRMIETIKRVSRLKGVPGARFVGIHLEGPFLSPKRAGALNRSHFRKPSLSELANLVSAGEGAVRMVTLAPELDGALNLISWLRNEGVIPAIGHSEAAYEDVIRAVDAGLSYATHCFNAMAGFHHRAPGAIGAIMTSDEIVAEIVGDGVHVHPAAISLLLRAKGCKKTCLVSDAAPLAGLAPGTYKWLGQKVAVDEEAAHLGNGTLAGATRLLNQQLSLLERSLEVPYRQLVEMATNTPSTALNLNSGLLAAGRKADIAIFDPQHRCRLTMVDGEIVYSA